MQTRYPDFNRLKDNTSLLNLCGIDIETTAIDSITGDIEKIWCISWEYSDQDEAKSVYWKDGVTKEHLTFLFENAGSLAIMPSAAQQSKLLLELRQVLTGETKYIPCFHNAQFEWRHLTECGLYIPYFHDSMVLTFCVITPSMMGGTGDEDAMRFYALRHIGHLGLCDAKLEFSNEWGEFTEEMLVYNKGDARSCKQIVMNLLPIITQDIQTFDAYILDLCATVQCAEMSRNGVYIDPDKLTALFIEKEKEHEELLSELRKLCPAVALKTVKFANPKSFTTPISMNGIYKASQIGRYVKIGKEGSDFVYRKIEQFNPGSSLHMAVALRYHCDWEPTKFSKKTGAPSVDASVIDKLSDRYVFAQLIKKYRKTDKLLSTYLKPLQHTDQDNRVHPGFLVCATRTSRLASRGPNFQNIPQGDIRKVVTASSKETKIVCIDLSQIELRILAWYMAMIVGKMDEQSTYLWKLYEQDADVHEANRQMMNTSRKAAKIAIFLFVYGGGPAKLASSVGIPVTEAKQVMGNLLKNVSALPKLKSIVEKSAEREEVLRTMYGHKLTYPNLWRSNDRGLIAQAKRQYFNGIIQGSQADIVKILMWQVRRAVESCGAKMLLQVHDEVVFEVPVGNVPWFCDALHDKFNNRTLLRGLKMVAVPGVGDSWAEAKEDGERREKELKEVA